MISVDVETRELPASLHIGADAREFLLENLGKPLHQSLDLTRPYSRFHFLEIRPDVVDARAERMDMQESSDQPCKTDTLLLYEWVEEK